MKKKVIFFLSQPIDGRNKIRFGYNKLSRYFDCQLWDISNLFFSKNKIFRNKIFYDKKNFLLIKNNFDFIKKATKINNKFFFSDCTTSKSLIFSLIQLYFKFIKNGFKFHISFRNNPEILFLSRYEKLLIIFNSNIFIFLKVLKLFIRNRICDLITPNPSLIFLCGQKDKMRDIKKTKLIETFSSDYEKSLSIKNYNFIKFKKYFVYLDQIVFNHPDDVIYKNYAPIIYNDDVTINSEKRKIFYNELQIFFKFLIKFYKIEIVISVHPKASNEDINFLKSNFQNEHFYIIQNNTPAVVKKSSAVICHSSASLEFAVLNYKPILFNYSQQFSNAQKKSVIAYSEILGLKPIDISKKRFNLSLKFNKLLYDAYIFNYISKLKNSKKKYWDIIISSLKYN